MDEFKLSDKERGILLMGLSNIPKHTRFLGMNYEESDKAIAELSIKIINYKEGDNNER